MEAWILIAMIMGGVAIASVPLYFMLPPLTSEKGTSEGYPFSEPEPPPVSSEAHSPPPSDKSAVYSNCVSGATNGLPLQLTQNASYYYNGSGNSTGFNDVRHYLSLMFTLQTSNTNQTITHVTYYVEIIDENTNHVTLAEMIHSHGGPITIQMEDVPNNNTEGQTIVPNQRDATTKVLITDADGIIHVRDSGLLENGSEHLGHIVVRGLNSDYATLCSDAGMPRYDIKWSFGDAGGLSLVREKTS
ncbi:MAG: hypothetical protein ABI347_00175 [Nitrososphaera sp.]